MSLRDRAYARRIAIAGALAIAIHEIAAALIPASAPVAPEARTVTQTIAFIRRTPPPTPRPTPPPKPVPTPRITSPPHPTLAPRVVIFNPAPKAAATPHRMLGGAAAPRHAVPRHRPPAPHAIPPSLADGAQLGQQNGGTGTGAGAGAGDGGLAGTGTGTGGVGNGNGGEANAGPCGDVMLEPGQLSFRRDGTVVQEVIAKIVFGDGRVEVAPFPYPFTYTGERQNPFSHDDMTLPGHVIPIQLPPAGIDPATFPKAVQLVLQYTDPETGHTRLPECAATAGTS